MLQIEENTVHLIEIAFFILMPDSQLVPVCFTDTSGFISPGIPDMAV